MGDEAPRQIASGLREHYSLEQMQDRRVLVVCNLKDDKLQGFVSQGMVLASKRPVDAADGAAGFRVELVEPAAGAEVGERLEAEGVSLPAWAPNAVKKHKVWEAVAPHLCTGADGVACYQGRPLATAASGLQCRVASNFNSPIS